MYVPPSDDKTAGQPSGARLQLALQVLSVTPQLVRHSLAAFIQPGFEGPETRQEASASSQLVRQLSRLSAHCCLHTETSGSGGLVKTTSPMSQCALASALAQVVEA